jgi:hypothetical protein
VPVSCVCGSGTETDTSIQMLLLAEHLDLLAVLHPMNLWVLIWIYGPGKNTTWYIGEPSFLLTRHWLLLFSLQGGS